MGECIYLYQKSELKEGTRQFIVISASFQTSSARKLFSSGQFKSAWITITYYVPIHPINYQENEALWITNFFIRNFSSRSLVHIS